MAKTAMEEMKEYIDTKFRLHIKPDNEWVLAELSKVAESLLIVEKEQRGWTDGDMADCYGEGYRQGIVYDLDPEMVSGGKPTFTEWLQKYKKRHIPTQIAQ